MRLPVRMHYKHGRYWYVFRNKWTALSKDYHFALAEYARLIATPSTEFSDLCNRVRSDFKARVKPSTLLHYEIALKRIEKAFAEISPSHVTGGMVFSFLEALKHKPTVANQTRAVLRMVMARAVNEELIAFNPVTGSARQKTPDRTRYLTDDEFSRIYEHASPLLRAVMMLLYLTGQRIGDILKIRRGDISDKGLYIEQTKTGQRMLIEVTPDLSAAIEDAKRTTTSVKGMTLFSQRNGKPVTYSMVLDAWHKAVKAAEVSDARIHDIRAKSGTDASEAGLDSKRLLGHKTEQNHNRYLRSKRIPKVQPLRQSIDVGDRKARK